MFGGSKGITKLEKMRDIDTSSRPDSSFLRWNAVTGKYEHAVMVAGSGGAIDLSGYYTKTEVDSKNNILLSSVYTKTQMDTLLNGKASVTAAKQTLINDLTDDGDPADSWLMYKGQYVFRPELVINDEGSSTGTTYSSEHILQTFSTPDWANVLNKPSSSVASIDTAVSEAHTHANKTAIDRLNVSAGNVLTIDGVEQASSTPTWDALTGKPTSTPASIDTAVSEAHTHANKSAIDRLGVSGANVLTIDGVAQTQSAPAWSTITGKPTSTPTQIDQAVTDDHTHANKASLDRLGVAANGNVTVDGVEKTGGTGGTTTATVSTIIANIAASGSFQTPMASEKVYNVWKVTSQTVTPTANIATDGTKALESGHYLSNAAANVYDADANSTYWAVNSGTAATNVWVGYDFVTPKTLVQMTYDVYTTAYGPKTVHVDWSDDGTNWNTAYSTSMVSPSTGTFYTIQFPSAGAHRYWRLFIVDTWTSLRLKTLTMHEGTSSTTKQLVKDADSITVTHDGTTLTLANGGASAIDVRVNVVG